MNLHIDQFVLWENNGVLVFSEPKRITKIIRSDYGVFVFVEGSDTGIPIKEIKVIE